MKGLLHSASTCRGSNSWLRRCSPIPKRLAHAYCVALQHIQLGDYGVPKPGTERRWCAEIMKSPSERNCAFCVASDVLQPSTRMARLRVDGQTPSENPEIHRKPWQTMPSASASSSRSFTHLHKLRISAAHVGRRGNRFPAEWATELEID